jgi:hypothetical protein
VREPLAREIPGKALHRLEVVDVLELRPLPGLPALLEHVDPLVHGSLSGAAEPESVSPSGIHAPPLILAVVNRGSPPNGARIPRKSVTE